MSFKDWIQDLEDAERDKAESRSVGEWLWRATRKLAEPARRRIAKEIGAHFQEAVTAHVENGMTEFEAQATALKELGNPKKAASRFQESYLTQAELNSLECCVRASHRPLFRTGWVVMDLFVLGGGLFLAGLAFNTKTHFGIFGFVLAALISSYLRYRFLGGILSRLVPQCEKFYRSFALAMFASEVAIALFLLCPAIWLMLLKNDYGMCALLPAIYMSLKRWWRISRVLRQSGSGSDLYTRPPKHLPSS